MQIRQKYEGSMHLMADKTCRKKGAKLNWSSTLLELDIQTLVRDKIFSLVFHKEMHTWSNLHSKQLINTISVFKTMTFDIFPGKQF